MPFLPLFTAIRRLAHVLTVPPTKACLLCAIPAGLDLYTGHARRHLPSAVPWISEDRLLLYQWNVGMIRREKMINLKCVRACVCVCACVRACDRVCVCVCVRARARACVHVFVSAP